MRRCRNKINVLQHFSLVLIVVVLSNKYYLKCQWNTATQSAAFKRVCVANEYLILYIIIIIILSKMKQIQTQKQTNFIALQLNKLDVALTMCKMEWIEKKRERHEWEEKEMWRSKSKNLLKKKNGDWDWISGKNDKWYPFGIDDWWLFYLRFSLLTFLPEIPNIAEVLSALCALWVGVQNCFFFEFKINSVLSH